MTSLSTLQVLGLLVHGQDGPLQPLEPLLEAGEDADHVVGDLPRLLHDGVHLRNLSPRKIINSLVPLFQGKVGRE